MISLANKYSDLTIISRNLKEPTHGKLPWWSYFHFWNRWISTKDVQIGLDVYLFSVHMINMGCMYWNVYVTPKPAIWYMFVEDHVFVKYSNIVRYLISEEMKIAIKKILICWYVFFLNLFRMWQIRSSCGYFSKSTHGENQREVC